MVNFKGFTLFLPTAIRFDMLVSQQFIPWSSSDSLVPHAVYHADHLPVVGDPDHQLPDDVHGAAVGGQGPHTVVVVGQEVPHLQTGFMQSLINTTVSGLRFLRNTSCLRQLLCAKDIDIFAKDI